MNDRASPDPITTEIIRNAFISLRGGHERDA